ncbi:MAG: DUF554 domain-containing protein [Actinobacteria bacterium]|nr:DUF554 domain-containing protein [Actinomycetota bacterium]
MPGTGVIVNVLAILAGTALGLIFGRLISERFRSIAFVAIGISTMIIGAGMSIGGLSALGKSHLGDYAAIVLVGSLVLGSLLGEAIRIEHHLERVGKVLQAAAVRSPILSPGRSREPGEKGRTLVEGFVTASLLFGVGAMTILGSIQDGLGDPSLLYLKAMLDGIASIALATTLGAGVGLSALPILILQGGIAAGAGAIEPIITPAVIDAIRASGGALIFAIGLDLSGVKRFPVGNMLPAIFIAAFLAGWLG